MLTTQQKLATLLTKPLPNQSLTAVNPTTPAAPFDSLIILDRHVDMITPLLTQLTYEGLIDEVIGIRNCRYLCPSTIFALNPDQPMSNYP